MATNPVPTDHAPATKELIALQTRHAGIVAQLASVLAVEAMLLDADRLEEWLTLMADDIRYVAPVRRKVANESIGVRSIDQVPSVLSHFNESLMSLQMRVRRLRTGHSHYDRPLALVRRVIGHPVLLEWDEASGEATACSSFLVHRAREEKEEAVFAGQREDIWRRDADGSWKLARRMLRIEHHILPPLTILF